MRHVAHWGTYIVLAIVALILAASAYIILTQHPSSGQRFIAKFKLNQPLPPAPKLSTRVAAPLPLIGDPPAASAHVYWRYLDPPGDQGAVGSCQCWAFRKEYDYLFHWRYRDTKHDPLSSCLFWYTEVGKGKDPGSSPDEYTPVLANEGRVPSTVYDWHGTPLKTGVYPQPSWVYAEALAHRYQAHWTNIINYYGGGEGSVQRAQWAIYHHNIVNVDFTVFGGPYSLLASSVNPIQDLPRCCGPGDQPTDPVEGGHAVNLVAYYRDLCGTANGGTVCGWFLAQNSWGNDTWGIGRDLQRHDPSTHKNGYFLMSERFVAEFAYGLAVLHLDSKINPTSPPRLSPPPAFRQPGPVFDKPLPPPHLSGKPTFSPGNWVYHVYAHDVCADGQWSFSCAVPFDMAPTINAASHAYNISTPFLLSLLSAECGLFTHSYRCDRQGGGYDYSFGSCQVTVATAGQYGVGNGVWDSYAGANATYVRNYENDVRRCIWLAARVVADMRNRVANRAYDRCFVDGPNLYVIWNAGPGNSCAFIFAPSGQAGTNYYDNFLGWYRFAVAYTTRADPYAPLFTLAAWCDHVKHCLSPYWGGKLSWAASVWWNNGAGPWKRLGHAVSADYYRKGRYTVTIFRHGKIFTWSRYHRAKVVN